MVVVPRECCRGSDFTNDDISYLCENLIERPIFEEESFEDFMCRMVSVREVQLDDDASIKRACTYLLH